VALVRGTAAQPAVSTDATNANLVMLFMVRDSPETECPGWRRGARPARREEGA
jgi:hypothetical protein